MKISQLRAVVAVAERGNFSEAALELQLTQPAVSHAIATLEEELGILLFARGRHGAVLTPVGERILHHIRQAMQHLEMLQEEANIHKHLYDGYVRVAAFRCVATHLLPKAIAQFHDQFPEVTVKVIKCLSYLDVEQCLCEGRADIGVTSLPTRDEFTTWEILRDEYVALLPPKAQVNSCHLTWEDIARYSPVIVSHSAYEKSLNQNLKQLAPFINTTSHIEDESIIVKMVHQGSTAAIMPRLAAVKIPSAVQVYSLPKPLERAICVAILPQSLYIKAVFKLLEMLKDFDFPTLAKCNF